MQLGGSDPEELAECARMAEIHGFDEVNLNVGCPSDNVQRRRSGACLMAESDLVARCGGFTSLAQVEQHLRSVDGVMIGRAVYHNPYLLAEIDRRFYDDPKPPPTRLEVLERFESCVRQELARGTALSWDCFRVNLGRAAGGDI